MKRECISPVLVFLLALVPRPGAAQARASVEEPVKMDTVLLPGSSPLVSFRILFGVGTALDPKDREGVAALTAALISGGGTRKLSYGEIIEAMYPMATTFTAQVDKEM